MENRGWHFCFFLFYCFLSEPLELMFKRFVHIFCSHLFLSISTFVHNFCFQFCSKLLPNFFQKPLFTTFIPNSYSQLVFKIVHYSCWELLFTILLLTLAKLFWKLLFIIFVHKFCLCSKKLVHNFCSKLVLLITIIPFVHNFWSTFFLIFVHNFC